MGTTLISQPLHTHTEPSPAAPSHFPSPPSQGGYFGVLSPQHLLPPSSREELCSLSVPNSPAGISLCFARGFYPSSVCRTGTALCPPPGPVWGIHCLSLFLQAHLVKPKLGESVARHVLLFVLCARKQKNCAWKSIYINNFESSKILEYPGRSTP